MAAATGGDGGLGSSSGIGRGSARARRFADNTRVWTWQHGTRAGDAGCCWRPFRDFCRGPAGETLEEEGIEGLCRAGFVCASTGEIRWRFADPGVNAVSSGVGRAALERAAAHEFAGGPDPLFVPSPLLSTEGSSSGFWTPTPDGPADPHAFLLPPSEDDDDRPEGGDPFGRLRRGSNAASDFCARQRVYRRVGGFLALLLSLDERTQCRDKTQSRLPGFRLALPVVWAMRASASSSSSAGNPCLRSDRPTPPLALLLDAFEESGAQGVSVMREAFLKENDGEEEEEAAKAKRQREVLACWCGLEDEVARLDQGGGWRRGWEEAAARELLRGWLEEQLLGPAHQRANLWALADGFAAALRGGAGAADAHHHQPGGALPVPAAASWFSQRSRALLRAATAGGGERGAQHRHLRLATCAVLPGVDDACLEELGCAPAATCALVRELMQTGGPAVARLAAKVAWQARGGNRWEAAYARGLAGVDLCSFLLVLRRRPLLLPPPAAAAAPPPADEEKEEDLKLLFHLPCPMATRGRSQSGAAADANDDEDSEMTETDEDGGEIGEEEFFPSSPRSLLLSLSSSSSSSRRTGRHRRIGPSSLPGASSAAAFREAEEEAQSPLLVGSHRRPPLSVLGVRSTAGDGKTASSAPAVVPLIATSGVWYALSLDDRVLRPVQWAPETPDGVRRRLLGYWLLDAAVSRDAGGEEGCVLIAVRSEKDDGCVALLRCAEARASDGHVVLSVIADAGSEASSASTTAASASSSETMTAELNRLAYRVVSVPGVPELRSLEVWRVCPVGFGFVEPHTNLPLANLLGVRHLPRRFVCRPVGKMRRGVALLQDNDLSAAEVAALETTTDHRSNSTTTAT